MPIGRGSIEAYLVLGTPVQFPDWLTRNERAEDSREVGRVFGTSGTLNYLLPCPVTALALSSAPLAEQA